MFKKIIECLHLHVPQTHEQLIDSGNAISTAALRFERFYRAFQDYLAHPSVVTLLPLILLAIAVWCSIEWFYKVMCQIRHQNEKKKSNPPECDQSGLPFDQ